jgi:hypothetical protein
MLEHTEAEVAKIGVRLIDDTWPGLAWPGLAWPGAESEAEMMLRGWFDAAGSGAKRGTSLIERRSSAKRRRRAPWNGCGTWLRPAMTGSSRKPKECPSSLPCACESGRRVGARRCSPRCAGGGARGGAGRGRQGGGSWPGRLSESPPASIWLS